MLKSHSLFYDKEISINKLVKDDNIFTNTQTNRFEADISSENISLKFSIQNQCEKGLFLPSFPSVNSNEDLISNLDCMNFLGKKRKTLDDSLNESEKEEGKIKKTNSFKKGSDAFAGNENIMWLSKNKNFKFDTKKNSQANCESPLKILNRDRLGNANTKKANLISFNGESKITDFFKEKKKNYNLINKQIGLNSNEAKDGALSAECYTDLKNCQSQMKSVLTFKAEEEKANFSKNEKLKEFNLASHYKMHNKNIIEIYNLNQKTIMEEIDNLKLPGIPENPDSESTCDLLHDKLIFTGQNNFKNKINYFNFEGINNNNCKEKNSIINFNNNESALNQIHNKEKNTIEKKQMENELFHGSKENPPQFSTFLKTQESNNNPLPRYYDNCIKNNLFYEESETKKEKRLFGNLDLNESQDYNNILERRENKIYEFSLQTNRQEDLPYASDFKENITENSSIGLLENSFSNLLLKGAQNAKTPLKKDGISEPRNTIVSPFQVNNVFWVPENNSQKLNSLLDRTDCKVELFNSVANDNPRQLPKHKYFLRSRKERNSEADNNFNGGVNKRKIRFSLSKKKVKRTQNREKRRSAFDVTDNKVISNYFKQEKTKEKPVLDKEITTTPSKIKTSDFDLETNNNICRKPLVENPNNPLLIGSFEPKEKSPSQKLNLNSNKKSLINKKMMTTSTFKDVDETISGQNNNTFGNHFMDENTPKGNFKFEQFSKKLLFDENETQTRKNFYSKNYFLEDQKQNELNLDLNSDILGNEEERKFPKFQFSAKTLDILRDLEFKKAIRTQDNFNISRDKDWRNVFQGFNNKFKLNFHKEKAKKCFEDMRNPNQISNNNNDKNITENEGLFEDKIILYKKNVFQIDNTLSTEETFVLSKFPLFSCMPFSETDELDLELHNCANRETNLKINHILISDSEKFKKDNKENSNKLYTENNKINTPTKKTKNSIKAEINERENKSKEAINNIVINAKSQNENVIEEIKQILSSTSIKEKYEGLLNRELILPYNYKNLFKKFENLDIAITEIKRAKRTTSFLNIQNNLKAKNIAFTIEDFQRILYVVPHFYIYKWEKLNNANKNSHTELIIDIPINIAQRIKEKYEEKTNFCQLQTYPFNPYPYSELPQEIINQRLLTFKKVLLYITSEEHKKFITDNQIKTNLNPFKHKTWHHKFDLSKCKEIPMFLLINQLSTQRRR